MFVFISLQFNKKPKNMLSKMFIKLYFNKKENAEQKNKYKHLKNVLKLKTNTAGNALRLKNYT